MAPFSQDFTIDLRRLRLLRELDEWGTVTAAARAAHLTPSAVSQQIAALAREVGVPLLEKQGRGVRLTGPALLLLDHAAVVEEQLERARADLAAWEDGTLGTVRVGGLSTAITGFVTPLLRRLRRERPGLRIDAVEMEAPGCFGAVNRGELDVAIAMDYTGAPQRQDRRFHRVDLITDRMDAVLPAGHPLATPGGIDLAALTDETWIGTREDEPCAQIMRSVCAGAGFSPDVRHRVNEWNSVVALVAAGAGVALVPRLAHPLITHGVVVCPILDVAASRLIAAWVRSGSQASPVVAAVLAGLVDIATERRSVEPAA